MKKLLLLTLIATVALPVIAKADDETFTYNLPTTSLDTVLDDSFDLSAFNPILGTLTGVKLTLQLAGTAIPQVLNFSGGAGSFSVSSYFPTTLTGPDGTTVSATTSSGLLSGVVDTGAFSFTPAPGPEVDQTVDSVVPGANFSSYEGAGTLAFELVAPSGAGFTTSGTETSGSAVLAYGGGGSLGAIVSVDYTFTDTVATPEPSAWALGLIVVSLFGILRMRSRCTA